MSQEKVLKTLKKTEKLLTVREIAKKLGISESTASTNLKALRKYKEIKWVIKDNGGRGVCYYFINKKKVIPK